MYFVFHKWIKAGAPYPERLNRKLLSSTDSPQTIVCNCKSTLLVYPCSGGMRIGIVTCAGYAAVTWSAANAVCFNCANIGFWFFAQVFQTNHQHSNEATVKQQQTKLFSSVNSPSLVISDWDSTNLKRVCKYDCPIYIGTSACCITTTRRTPETIRFYTAGMGYGFLREFFHKNTCFLIPKEQRPCFFLDKIM